MGDHVPNGDTRRLHESEGGIRPIAYNETAYGYARQLARYVPCASTIRSHVIANYGVRLPIDEIEGLQAQYRARRETFKMASEAMGERESDRLDFRVRGLVKPPPQKRVDPDIPEVEDEEAKPIRRRSPVILSELIAAVAEDFGLRASDILGLSRKSYVTQARKTVAYILHQRGNSYANIGKKLNRDHSTIINAVQGFKDNATEEMWRVARRYLGGEE